MFVKEVVHEYHGFNVLFRSFPPFSDESVVELLRGGIFPPFGLLFGRIAVIVLDGTRRGFVVRRSAGCCGRAGARNRRDDSLCRKFDLLLGRLALAEARHHVKRIKC